MDLLDDACTLEGLEAITELGMQWMRGEGLPANPAYGEQHLRAAARRGDRVAAIFLKRESSATPGDDGFYLYSTSLLTFDERIATRLRSEAAECFLRGHQRGDAMCSTNLAYLVRRGEVSLDRMPALDELLQPGLAIGHEFARMNQALRLARGVQCEVDWQAADALVASLPGSQRIAEWWQGLAASGDSEGEMVLWWLARHGLTASTLPSPPLDWDVPVWMS